MSFSMSARALRFRRYAAIGAGVTLSLVASLPAIAQAATYQVGAGKPYATIQDTLGMLAPGDVVEVDGDATYPGDLWFRAEQSGTADAPVTIRGIPVNGKRPVIQGVGTEQWHDIIVFFNANHFVFEGFEIIGDGNVDHFGLVHKADDVTLRDLVVHGVANQGLLGTDSESGSLTLESSEFYGNGNDLYQHQIYMATDESMYPGSVFRMQYCYVHDGAGGNNVKSRAERNEIYYNWIEGAVYHELDLIGPDGQDPSLAREDSDVVGNVLVKHSEWRIARIGGDGTGNTAGRYRFVNNTMVLGASSDVAIGLQQTVESLEMDNNVIVRIGAAGGSVWNHAEPEGPDPELVGSHNWIQDGIGDIPAGFTNTLTGASAGFQNDADFDFRPVAGSPLLDAGTTETLIAGAPVPNALGVAADVPPSRLAGTQGDRPVDAAIDIGAFELGSGTIPGEGTVSTGVGTGGSGAGTGSGAGGGGGSGGDGANDSGDDGCSCSTAIGHSNSGARSGAALLIPVLGVALLASRRRRRVG
ncbi:MAG: hypothetical protein U0271_42755 [Polyangiaceae bacterium]